ncbi:T9SS type A sorting domain-containing protein [Flavobacterium sp. MAH-1]|uniref:T9SS type A sorting domain-containing protein n=1 Tax=Flavobacterium agri TaxID=2743471 RepID=A0A7Y8Y357_9FLAO|nr:T9SS type A sorting domain-containing protein [Flavobacterium agri]NUY81642.1 T9SS type A sorting domain-containing protein [Flavobacterium agri]NYA71666.1 T9SS type A sorting domain-containing protein [Flavobacterium agri]
MKKLLLSLVLVGSVAQAQFWTPKATGFATASRGLDCFAIVDQNVIWAKAYDGSGAANQTIKDITKSIDGGNTWTPGVVSAFSISTLAMSSITAVSANTAWVSMYPTGAATGGIWKTTNGGTSWTKQTTALFTGGTSFTNLVYFWDENNGVCQGDPEGGYFEIYTTSNGGTTWTRVPSANIPAPLTGEYGYVHNYDVVGNTFWFGTNLGRIFRSTDMGLTWQVFQSPVSDFGGTGESGQYTFSDQNKGLLNSSFGLLWSTTDGGATWTPVVPTGTFGNNSLEYVPGTTNVISTGGATGYGSYYSLDDGLTWQVAEATTQFTVLAFRDNTTGFAGGFNTNATTGGVFKYTGTQLRTIDLTREQVSVYPNPTNGIVNITGADVKQVTVFDISGKKVYQNEFMPGDANVDLSVLEIGTYLLQATDDNGSVKTIKVIKQ